MKPRILEALTWLIILWALALCIYMGFRTFPALISDGALVIYGAVVMALVVSR
jgi:hypothetical protein